MNLTTQARDNVLVALDPFFAERGFARTKRSQEWKKEQSSEHIRLVHLNFGLYEKTGEMTIIPTIAVRHKRLEEAKVAVGIVEGQHAKESASAALSLAVLAKKEPHYAYQVKRTSAQAIANELIHDLSIVGLPLFEQLERLDWILQNLSEPIAKQWCVPSTSHRARLIPIIWYVKGDSAMALQELQRLKAELGTRDQLLPNMAVFAERLSQLVRRSP